MKVVEKYTPETDYCGADYEIEVTDNEGTVFQASVYDMAECPEDARLERDLNWVLNIPYLIEQAYEAGKRGDELEIIDLTEEENGD